MTCLEKSFREECTALFSFSFNLKLYVVMCHVFPFIKNDDYPMSGKSCMKIICRK